MGFSVEFLKLSIGSWIRITCALQDEATCRRSRILFERDRAFQWIMFRWLVCSVSILKRHAGNGEAAFNNVSDILVQDDTSVLRPSWVVTRGVEMFTDFCEK